MNQAEFLQFLVSAEDCILSKLEWAKLGESERQYRDALKIARVAGGDIDCTYLRRWASELGVAELLETLFQEAAS